MTQLLEGIKDHIKSRLPRHTFSLWINPLTLLDATDSTIVLGCPNKFSRNWVTENYLDLILDAVRQEGKNVPELSLKVDTRRPQPEEPPQPTDQRQLPFPVIPSYSPHSHGPMALNTNFIFDRFIVGRSNEFAYSASNALAHGHSCDYTTLLLLANTGLGKTHLSHAVGNEVLQHNPGARVYYITAEEFANEMIASLKHNRIEQFKSRYRKNCDILLLDEIHFLGGKEKTQLELAYTLDALTNDNKKIVFTSAMPPKDIPRMSGELSSRLTSGLVSTIHDPDYDTRVKILTRKSVEHAVPLTEETIHYLASHLKKDIRQMESAMKCFKAKAELLNTKIDLDQAKQVVTCLVSSETSVTADAIKQLVSTYYKVEPDALNSKSRKKVLAYPRNIFLYLARRHTDDTLHSIGATVDRSHSTVLYAVERVEHEMKSNADMRRQVDFLSKKIEDMKK